MRAKPNEIQLRQLARLNTQEFSQLIRLFEEELSIITDDVIMSNDESYTRKAQGQARTLRDLLILIRKAPELLDKKQNTAKQTK